MACTCTSRKCKDAWGVVVLAVLVTGSKQTLWLCGHVADANAQATHMVMLHLPGVQTRRVPYTCIYIHGYMPTCSHQVLLPLWLAEVRGNSLPAAHNQGVLLACLPSLQDNWRTIALIQTGNLAS